MDKDIFNSIKAASDQIDPRIGSFEQRLLAAINKLGTEAWGSKLQLHLSQVLKRNVAIGQLYLSLSNLEARGFISSSVSDPEPIRGGRSKKVFRLETPGARALERSAAELEALGALRPKEKYHHGEFAT
jgi:predicted ArsR family transcriptional regulator